MVTHHAPLDEYLNRLIAAVENLANQVEEHREVLDGMYGQMIKNEEQRQVGEHDAWQEFHNINNHLDNIANALEQMGDQE